MLRFLDCFYRHRRVLLAMVGLALVLSVGLVATRPRAYEATARVWVDTSIQGDHPNPYISAADAGNVILGELLRTRAFCAKVAGRSQLVPGLSPGHGPDDQARVDAAYQALSGRVILGVAGPNVVTVTFRNGAARLAAGTTQAVVDLFKEEVLNGQASRAKATATFYEQQVKAAREELSRADGRISDYLGTSQDPYQPALGSAPSGGTAGEPGSTTDVNLLALQRDDDAVRKRTDDLTQKLNQAQLDLTVARQATPGGFRLIDAALAPEKPVSRTAPLLAAGAGGLCAGGLLSLLVLTALAAADGSLRYAAEVEPALGFHLVGTVPHIERGPWPR